MTKKEYIPKEVPPPWMIDEERRRKEQERREDRPQPQIPLPEPMPTPPQPKNPDENPDGEEIIDPEQKDKRMVL